MEDIKFFIFQLCLIVLGTLRTFSLASYMTMEGKVIVLLHGAVFIGCWFEIFFPSWRGWPCLSWMFERNYSVLCSLEFSLLLFAYLHYIYHASYYYYCYYIYIVIITISNNITVIDIIIIIIILVIVICLCLGSSRDWGWWSIFQRRLQNSSNI